MTKFKFTVVVEQDEDGYYVASCPALKGCHSQGKTYKEAMKNIREAIELNVEVRRERGEPIPFEQAVEEVEIVAKAIASKA
jgi:predicted RNase H-like HicB family nuclease